MLLITGLFAVSSCNFDDLLDNPNEVTTSSCLEPPSVALQLNAGLALAKPGELNLAFFCLIDSVTAACEAKKTFSN